MPDPIVPLEMFEQFNGGENMTQTRLDQAIGAIRDYCGWHVAPAVRQTLIVDGNGRRALLLDSLHVTEVHSVSEHGVALTVDDPTQQMVGVVEWSRDGLLERNDRPWSTRRRAVVVELTHGYDEVPAALAGIVLDMVAQNLAIEPDEQPEKIGPFEWAGSQGGTALSGAARAVLDRRYVLSGRV